MKEDDRRKDDSYVYGGSEAQVSFPARGPSGQSFRGWLAAILSDGSTPLYADKTFRDLIHENMKKEVSPKNH